MAIGTFDLLGELGKGAGSTVFRIRRHGDGRDYALKVVKLGSADDRVFLEQLENERRVGQRLKHESLCKVLELEIDKSFFGKPKGGRLLLELVEGVPLTPNSSLPCYKLLTIFARVARAVAAMHAAGVFHADLKPENILVTPKGEVKVIDFGVAWLKGEAKDRVQGTLDYLAPEQAKRKRVDERTDIFNFGATMYRVCCGGTLPAAYRQTGMGKIDDIDKLVKPMPALRMEIPADVDELVRQCVRYHPEERPQAMQEVYSRLKALAKKYIAARREHKAETAESKEEIGD